jgi:hypothetical protein
MEEVALVAAYCEMEAESFKTPSTPTRGNARSNGPDQVVTSTQVWVHKPKGK